VIFVYVDVIVRYRDRSTTWRATRAAVLFVYFVNTVFFLSTLLRGVKLSRVGTMLSVCTTMIPFFTETILLKNFYKND